MRTFVRTPCARVGWVSLLPVLVLAAGCQPVREDRTMTWSGSGNSVGFQHGRDGVFVADKEGGGLTKIFQPGADVLATSPPLWHPAGGRLIFTTARAPQGDTPVPSPVRGEPDPAGRVFAQRPVVYTCWLREEARDGRSPEPEPLFEAACDHVGYVAANLVLDAVYRRLGLEEERREVAGRLGAERAAARDVPWAQDLTGPRPQTWQDRLVPPPR